MSNMPAFKAINGIKNNFKTILVLVVILLVCSLGTYTTIFHPSVARHLGQQTIFIIIGSLALTLLLIIIMVGILGTLKKRFGIYDFFIGDEGTYSLSRLQAVLWAVVIISYQIAVIVSLLTGAQKSLILYQAAFSESSIWLLSLSLTSYIAVKGIMINKIAQKPSIKNSRSKNPQWGDILIGDNGLDFAKCQMLIWTTIAIFAYLNNCYQFIWHLLAGDTNFITHMFKHFYEDYGSTVLDKDANTYPYIPYLPWTFVVLMGMSQGAYVGKKLVPTFKIDEAQAQSALDIKNKMTNIDIEIAAKQSLFSNLKPISSVGIENMRQLQLNIQDLLNQKAAYQMQLTQLKN